MVEMAKSNCGGDGDFKAIPLLFVYAGSKCREWRYLRQIIPPHHHAVSVFGGTGADFLCRPPSPLETFNDIAGDICNVFQVLKRERPRRQLVRMLENTLLCRQEYELALRVLQNGTDDAVERAFAFLVVANQGRVGTFPSAQLPSNWAYRRSRIRARWLNLPRWVDAIATRFRRVQVENQPWEEMFRRYDSASTIFTVDPPYMHSVRVSKNLYFREMTEADHVRLLETVTSLKGRALVFGYDSKLYSNYLARWTRYEFQVRCIMSPNLSKPQRKEIVWANFGTRVKPDRLAF